MSRRRWRQDRHTGEMIEIGEGIQLSESTGPFIQGDIEPYQSMVDGRMITSRSKHRTQLRDHGLIEIGNETSYLKSKSPTTPPGLKEAVIKAVKQYGRQ